MIYRPDIDGLRAVSVLAVIAFHTGLGFSGGYVGVDVFFVISGYLITGIIASDLSQDRFSIREFWKRRILRIWPASTVMTVAVLFVASIVMMPRAFVTTAQDAASQFLMIANINFWRTTDYFGVQAEFRPLLHCWSLAVEEQFYIVLPPVLMIVWRLGPRVVIGAVAAIAITSFIISVVILSTHPWATFYLLPTRAWELALGALLALAGLRFNRSRAWREFLAWLGFAAIVAPMFLYDASTPFPGVAALPVCLGAVILIATPGTLVSRLLAIGPMRAIGLASYSLYLWHWPVLAFIRYIEGPQLSASAACMALVATAVLGALSWRFVEQPFRGGARTWQFRRVAIAGGASIVFGIALAGVVWLSGGFPSRLSDEVRDFYADDIVEQRWAGGDELRAIGSATDGVDRRFLLLGDSHGMAISGALDAAARSKSMAGWASLRHGKVPLSIEGLLQSDSGWTDRMLAEAIANGVTDVLLCARWNLYLEIAIKDECGNAASPACTAGVIRRFATALGELNARLAAGGVRLWFLKEVPESGMGSDPERSAVKAHLFGASLPVRGVSRDEHVRRQQHVGAVLKGVEATSVRVWDLSEPFFTDSETSVFRDSSAIYYVDGNHLSRYGAMAVLAKPLQELLAQVRDSRNRTSSSAKDMVDLGSPVGSPD